jgi:hypothetical protein
VGTTAQPVAQGKTTTSMLMYVQPQVSIDTASRSPYSAQSGLAVDGEVRIGVDDKSDVGLRAVGYSGIVLNYKRMLADTAEPIRFAIIPGIGVVNGGQHFYGEFTLVFSGHEPPTGTGYQASENRKVIVPYGGFRASQVVPLQPQAVTDQATYGAFLGIRFGTTDFGISPEVGVFHDHSALGLRPNDIVIVPAIAIHGNRLIDLFRHLPRRYSRQIRPRVVDRHPALPPTLMPSYQRPVWQTGAPAIVGLPIVSPDGGRSGFGNPRFGLRGRLQDVGERTPRP